MCSYHRGNVFVPCGNGVRNLWKWGTQPVETGCATCGNYPRDLWKRVRKLWKWGARPVEIGSVTCGKGSSECVFTFPPIDGSLQCLYNHLMSNRDDYEKKLETLTAIEDDRIKSPHHVPVDAYTQESQSLYHQALADKDALTAAGLSWELVEDLPLRIGAMIEAESSYYVQRKTQKETATRWTEESQLAYKLKKQLHDSFRYAFRNNPGLLGTLKFTVKGRSHANMIQALNDLSHLGKKNVELLEAVRFDMSLLDKAAQMSKDMSALLAETINYGSTIKGVKKIRDQAYTHLKEAVDEICRCGQFVFRQDEERFRGYRSAHLREKYLERKREAKTKKESKPEPRAPAP